MQRILYRHNAIKGLYMKIKKLSILILSILIICQIFNKVNIYADDNETLGLPEFPKISSDYVVLMDADSGEVLYSSNADTQCYPASTTKLLTALLTVENCSLSDTVTYSQAAVDSIEYGDANASISPGEELTVEQSLYCLILRSANEVAYGLAEHVGQTVSSFASMMNNRMEELGATHTHFTNPSGLSDQFHYTTPYDMALIAQACFNNKTLMKIVSHSGVYTIGPTNKSNFTRYYRHRYQMLPGGDYAYKYSLGGKTGYTDDAGNCLVSFAQKDDLRLICVIMKSTDAGRYKDTTALFDYYFNNYHKVYLDNSTSSLSMGQVDILNITGRVSSSSDISIGFADDTYLLVPTSVKLSELTGIVTYSDNPAYAGRDGGFACITYYSGNVNVGNATIMINYTGNDKNTGLNGVPRASYSTYNPSSDTVFHINILIVAGGIATVCAVTFGIIFISRNFRRRRGHYGSRRLRF